MDRASQDNADRVLLAMARFGAPVESLKVTPADLVRHNLVVQIGLPPRRIDVLTDVSGLEFEEAWPDRVTHLVRWAEVGFLDRASLIKNERAAGRPQDLADLDRLGESAAD